MENVKTDMHSVSCNYVLRTQNLIMIEHKVSGIKKKKNMVKYMSFTQLRLWKAFCEKPDK